GRLILLDLYSEALPQYLLFESFYGHYYIWNMLHDFGGNNFLFGSLISITNGPQSARNFSGDHMIGVGITMEGINQNEIMYEFALEQSWRSPLNNIELNDWLIGFVIRRYTGDHSIPNSALSAWQLLGNSIYLRNVRADRPIILSRPRLNIEQNIYFDIQCLFLAWELLVNASNELNSDLFRYDLVDITKEILQYKFVNVYIQFMSAYNQSDLYGVSTQAAILVDILTDIELVLASDRRFLLGNWIQDALQFAQNEENIHFYNLLLNFNYYAQRWNVFFDVVIKSLIEGHSIDSNLLNKRLFLEAELPFFMLDIKKYPTNTQGDSIMIVRQLFNKYHSSLNDFFLKVKTTRKIFPLKYYFDET
ncbi:unnamed protein product, partial [Rotaria sordida]